MKFLVFARPFCLKFLVYAPAKKYTSIVVIWRKQLELHAAETVRCYIGDVFEAMFCAPKL